MEFIDSIWQVGIIALLAGVMIGALAYRIFSPSVKQSDGLRTELDNARQELTDYRASVNSHFAKTSELVNDLTHNYVRVYQHLAEGAQTLGDSRELNKLLEQQQGKVLLAVDDESESTEAAAGTMRSEPVPKADESAKSNDGAGEPVAETSVDESPAQDRGEDAAAAAQPATAAGTGDSEAPTETPVQTGKKPPSPKTGDDAGSGKPFLDVSKIGGKDADGKDESTPGVAAVISETGESQGVKPTRH